MHLGERTILVVSAPTRNVAALRELTAAELDVAAAVVEGASTPAIARRRGTSARTVANQLASIYRKLGVGSRVELAALLVSARATVRRGERQ